MPYNLSRGTVYAKGSPVPRELRDRFADVVNVLDFGARGDGVTDDSAAFSAAIAALPAGAPGVPGGGAIFIPRGRYWLGTSGITVPAGKRGLRLVGAGQAASILAYGGVDFAVTVGDSSADTLKFFMQDLQLDVSAAPGGAGGVHATRVNGGALLNVAIQGRVSGADSGTGIWFDGTGNWTGSVVLDNVVLGGSNFSVGMRFDGPAANTANHFQFRNCSISRQYGSAKPGTGTIGFWWGATAGDGTVDGIDVENFDVGYQIDGRYLNGPIRVENNSVAVAFGALSVSNTLWAQPFVNSVLATYAPGQAYNSLFDTITFSNTLGNGSTTGTVQFYEPTEHDLDYALRAGVAAEHRVRFRFMTAGGNTTHYFGKDQFNRLNIHDQGGYRRFSVGGYYVTDDPTDLIGRGAGAIRLNVGTGEGQGTGGTEFGDGLQVVVAWMDATGALHLSSKTGPVLKAGSGSPEGVVAAPVGSIFLRTDGGAGTTLYVKESGTGNTGWIGK